MTDETKSEATCATCPYGVRGTSGWKPGIFIPKATGEEVECRRRPRYEYHLASQWCGEHPERPRAAHVVNIESSLDEAAFERLLADPARRAVIERVTRRWAGRARCSACGLPTDVPEKTVNLGERVFHGACFGLLETPEAGKGDAP